MADGNAAAIRFESEIVDLESYQLGDAQQAVRHDRNDRRVAPPLDGPFARGDSRGGLGLREVHAARLTSSSSSPLAPDSGKNPVGSGTYRRWKVLQLGPELERSDYLGARRRRLLGIVQGGEVVGNDGIGDGVVAARFVEPRQRGRISPLGVGGNAGLDELEGPT